jgi:hypothetical protein
MSKSLLHRIFGVGKIPTERRARLESQGILVLEEGLRGSMSYRKYRAPGKRSGRGREGIVGAIALDKLKVKVENETRLCLSFETEDFHADRSGSIVCRLSTDRANTLQRKFWQLSRG